MNGYSVTGSAVGASTGNSFLDQVLANAAAERIAKSEAKAAKKAADQSEAVTRTVLAAAPSKSISATATLAPIPDAVNEPTVVPATVHNFGENAAKLRANQQSVQQPSMRKPAPVSPQAGSLRIDTESREILRYISQDFVLLNGQGAGVAYHIETGDTLSQKFFVKYCSKHYGDITIINADGKEERAPSGAIWWNWDDPLQRVARRLVMEPTSKPEHEDNPEVFNLWHVRKRTMAPPKLDAQMEDIAPLLDHLMYISDGDQTVVAYFLNWLATLYQTPEVKIPSAILFYSKFGGVGKSMLYKLLAKVFGPCMVGSCSGRALTKSFDDVTEHKRLLMINEVARSEKADGYENFKNMISEEQVSFEGKGRAAKDIRNITHYIVTTNNKDSLPLMQGDRRIAVFMCNAAPKSDAYYAELVAWMEGPGPALLAGVLASWKFEASWNPHAPVPQTAATRTLQDAAQGELYGVVKELIEQRIGPFDKDIIVVREAATKLNNMGLALTKPANITSLGKVLKALYGEPEPLRILKRKSGKSMPLNVYVIRNAEQWRGKATSAEQRMHHMETGVRLFPVQDQSDDSEVANHE